MLGNLQHVNSPGCKMEEEKEENEYEYIDFGPEDEGNDSIDYFHLIFPQTNL